MSKSVCTEGVMIMEPGKKTTTTSSCSRTAFSISDDGREVWTNANGFLFDGFTLQLFAASRTVDTERIRRLTMLKQIDSYACEVDRDRNTDEQVATYRVVLPLWTLSANESVSE